jgi:hypothetical protein
MLFSEPRVTAKSQPGEGNVVSMTIMEMACTDDQQDRAAATTKGQLLSFIERKQQEE